MFTFQIMRTLVAAQVHEGHLSFESPVLGGRLHFLHFATSELPQVVGLLRAQQLTRSVARLGCTGGGAFKYKAVLEESLGLEVVAIDEMESLVRGLEVKYFTCICFLGLVCGTSTLRITQGIIKLYSHSSYTLPFFSSVIFDAGNL